MTSSAKTSKTIFLVDDDAEDRQLLKEAFLSTVKKIKIIEFSGGEDLIEFIKSGKRKSQPSLVITDMNMPRMNGLETLIFFRSVASCRQIPVVMFSSATNQDYINQAYIHGVNAFIKKPCAYNEYLKIVDGLDFCFLNHFQNAATESSIGKIRNRSILVIEDNPDHYASVTNALKQIIPGINVITTQNSTSALDFLMFKWKTLPDVPQLILLDLYLPSRDVGLHLLESIKKFFVSHNKPMVPVLIMSCTNDRKDIDLSLKYLANAFVLKQLELDDWKFCLQDLCSFWLDTVSLPKVKTGLTL